MLSLIVSLLFYRVFVRFTPYLSHVPQILTNLLDVETMVKLQVEMLLQDVSKPLFNKITLKILNYKPKSCAVCLQLLTIKVYLVHFILEILHSSYIPG